MTTASVRYIVEDLEAAIGFYRDQLGFEVDMHPAPTFAMLSRRDLRLLLSVPGGHGGGGQILAMADDPSPAAGIDSSLRSATSRARSSGCERLARAFATKS